MNNCSFKGDMYILCYIVKWCEQVTTKNKLAHICIIIGTASIYSLIINN